MSSIVRGVGVVFGDDGTEYRGTFINGEKIV